MSATRAPAVATEIAVPEPDPQALPVEGGYRITGRLPYASRIRVRDVGARRPLVPPREEGGEPRAIVFLIPRRDRWCRLGRGLDPARTSMLGS